MSKKVLAGAGSRTKKYFYESEFDGIPSSVKEEIREICILTAEKLSCDFLIGFYDTGDIFFEIIRPEDLPDFDDIGASLEIKEIRTKKQELIKSLKLWYMVYKTDEGDQIKKSLL